MSEIKVEHIRNEMGIRVNWFNIEEGDEVIITGLNDKDVKIIGYLDLKNKKDEEVRVEIRKSGKGEIKLL